MMKQVRVRYAPSPTGEPHVGNIRTALFNWLFARHMGGAFVVRIEDTDVARQAPGALEAIMEGLRWLNIDWDEGPEVGGPFGPYIQSQRLDLYSEAAAQLIKDGHAYQCYCSPQRLQEMREDQATNKKNIGYDRLCRELDENEATSFQAKGRPFVVRFKIPLEGETTFHDAIRGDVKFAHQTMDDFVILKSDGYPTYHLANVVDDSSMAISHVLRSDEWVSSTPKHVLLYDALGYEKPTFAHLPIILGPDRSKLSKRHGAVSVLHYRAMGFLPDAMLNFLVLLGWSLDDHTEIFSRADMIRHFSIERIGRAGAIFSHDKLTWMNGVYVRQLSHEDLAHCIRDLLDERLPTVVPRPISEEYIEAIVPLVQERLKTLIDAPSLMEFFFLDELDYPRDELIQKGLDKTSTETVLNEVLQLLSGINAWSAQGLENELRSLAERLQIKTGQLFGSIRVALTGRKAAPPLFETMEVLGQDRCIRRLKASTILLNEG